MRHLVVRRATLLFGAGLVIYAAGFAWLAGDEPAPGAADTVAADGALAFERHCAACHAASGLRAGMRTEGAGAHDRLEIFLRDHGDASDVDDQLILDFLAAGIFRSSPELR